MNLSSPFRRQGFSLIEMLLVLGVLAVLIVAAFVVYPQVRDRNQANAEILNLTSMKAGLVSLYASKGGAYTGLKNDVANQARVVPASINGGNYAATAALKSSWGEDITIGAVSSAITIPEAVPANRSFRIIYAKVPESICLGMVTAAVGNFFKVTVDGTDLITKNGDVLEFDPGKAAQACNGGASGQVAFYSK